MAIMYLGRVVEIGFNRRHIRSPPSSFYAGLALGQPGAPTDAALNRIEIKGEVPSMLRRPTDCEFHTRCQYAQNICRRVFPEPSASSADAWKSLRCHLPQIQELLSRDSGKR